MDYERLSKFFAGELNFREKETLLASLAADEEQMEEATRLKNSWAAAQLMIAPGDKKIAREGWKKFRTSINNNNNHRQLWRRLALAVIWVGVIVNAAFFYPYFSHKEETVAYHNLLVPAGQYTQLVLSDGSEIWLNSRSKLIYPERFTSGAREVRLEGEGFFKIASDKAHPFIVKTDRLDVVATGTRFNVSAYPDDGWVATTLVEGKVKLQSETKKIDCMVEPGQIAYYMNEEHRISLQKTDTDRHISWTHGEFQFKEMTLANIAKRLERNFNVVFVFNDEALKNRKYTGAFYNHQSIETIMRVIKTSTKLQYWIDNDTVYISK
jgi:ferric-dicitrate binding protein FerR (iron transport regulator)